MGFTVILIHVLPACECVRVRASVCMLVCLCLLLYARVRASACMLVCLCLLLYARVRASACARVGLCVCADVQSPDKSESTNWQLARNNAQIRVHRSASTSSGKQRLLQRHRTGV